MRGGPIEETCCANGLARVCALSLAKGKRARMTDQPLSSGPAEARLTPAHIWNERTVAASAVLAVVVVLGDGLFFGHEPGISLTLFFFAVIAGVVALNARTLRGPRAW